MITTPENWHWNISPEEVQKIKAVDRETIDRVYFSNLEKFKGIVGKYCYHIIRDPYYINDCLQQIYVDLDKFDYTNNRTFYYSLINCFRRARRHSTLEISLFTPVKGKDNDRELADFLGKDFFAELEERETGEEKALVMIKSQTELTDLERDFLTAVAFRVRPYEGLFYEEFTRYFGKNYTGQITA